MQGDDMTVAHHPHPFAPRWAPFVAVAFAAIVAASLLLVVDWAVAVPGGVADAAPARSSIDSTTAPMDIGQQFYKEKAMAPAQELPAQF
jgi:hypothetical protein